MTDIANLEQAFKEAVAGLPTYKRLAAHQYVTALRAEIARLEKDRFDAYEQGERAGMSRANSRPGDGDMGG